jgi:HEAT repeat protein
LALGDLHLEPERAVPALTAGLEGKDSSLRSASAESLRWFYSDARPAVPALLRALDDPRADVELRMAAVITLQQIAPEVLEKVLMRERENVN